MQAATASPRPDRELWIAACAHRLRQRWPRLPVETLEDVARELLEDPGLHGLAPTQAAEAWLERAS